jgi:hypothetical protein
MHIVSNYLKESKSKTLVKLSDRLSDSYKMMESTLDDIQQELSKVSDDIRGSILAKMMKDLKYDIKGNLAFVLRNDISKRITSIQKAITEIDNYKEEKISGLKNVEVDGIVFENSKIEEFIKVTKYFLRGNKSIYRDDDGRIFVHGTQYDSSLDDLSNSVRTIYKNLYRLIKDKNFMKMMDKAGFLLKPSSGNIVVVSLK